MFLTDQEMRYWITLQTGRRYDPALSVQEMRLYIHSISCDSVIAPAIFILLHIIRKNINELPEKI